VKKLASQKKAPIGALVLATSFLFAPSQSVRAENVTAVFSVFPPLSYPKAAERSAGPGILVEIYQKVLPALGYNVDLLQLPPKRIVALMAKGQTVDLYGCADYTIGKRPHYAYGPPIISLNVQLFQNASEPIMASHKDLKSQTVIKQHGFNGLEKLLHSSNTFLNAHSSGVAAMFTHGRANYMLDFKERIEAMLIRDKNTPQYRTYHIRSFVAHMCLNRRFPDAEERIQRIHDAMVNFQDTSEGRQLFQKYGYTGRFGAQFETASETK